MLSINISELIWTIISFLILYFILKKFLFDPLVTFMDERANRMAAAAAEAERMKIEAEQLKDASSEIIKAAETQATGIIADGEAADAAAFAASVEEAKSKLASMRNDKQDDISESIKNNSEGIAARRTELASAVADRILSH